MAQAAGFYPPGTYVKLANGETGAVGAARRARQHTLGHQHSGQGWRGPGQVGMQGNHHTGDHDCVTAITAENVRVTVNIDKVRKARERIREL
jgi:hypothetical protein